MSAANLIRSSGGVCHSPLNGAARHSSKAADLLIRQVQSKMQDQNTLLLNGQTGESVGHKLIFNMQVMLAPGKKHHFEPGENRQL